MTTGCLFVTALLAAGFGVPAIAENALSLTNFQLVESHAISLSRVSATYSAVLVNSGDALDGVSGIGTSLNSSNVTIVRGTLNFGSVPAGSHIKSTNTFTIVVDRRVKFDFSEIQWTFQVPPHLVQEGPALVGIGAITDAGSDGYSVALSSDGNTVLVGDWRDNRYAGAAWVFSRDGGVWHQQGAKLFGTGGIGTSSLEQGGAVALSGDGNTALVGGLGDNEATGAVWVFARLDGVWSQQAKLVGTEPDGILTQGISVAVSEDGNTALVGASGGLNVSGAAWVFTRRDGVWSQQGPKLVGTGSVNPAQQGRSVALSADGNTALIGGWEDNKFTGAMWVFTRSGEVWTQQGQKLVGTGPSGTAVECYSVALSADGSTAMMGGWVNNIGAVAVWIFAVNNGMWSQQAWLLIPTVAGYSSVALSGDGNTSLVGAPQDNQGLGSTWVLKRNNGVWGGVVSRLVAADPAATQQGRSVALTPDGTSAVVGGKSSNIGSAWVFSLSVVR